MRLALEKAVDSQNVLLSSYCSALYCHNVLSYVVGLAYQGKDIVFRFIIEYIVA
jgi:hypothetical protein